MPTRSVAMKKCPRQERRASCSAASSALAAPSSKVNIHAPAARASAGQRVGARGRASGGRGDAFQMLAEALRRDGVRGGTGASEAVAGAAFGDHAVVHQRADPHRRSRRRARIRPTAWPDPWPRWNAGKAARTPGSSVQAPRGGAPRGQRRRPRGLRRRATPPSAGGAPPASAAPRRAGLPYRATNTSGTTPRSVAIRRCLIITGTFQSPYSKYWRQTPPSDPRGRYATVIAGSSTIRPAGRAQAHVELVVLVAYERLVEQADALEHLAPEGPEGDRVGLDRVVPAEARPADAPERTVHGTRHGPLDRSRSRWAPAVRPRSRPPSARRPPHSGAGSRAGSASDSRAGRSGRRAPRGCRHSSRATPSRRRCRSPAGEGRRPRAAARSRSMLPSSEAPSATSTSRSPSKSWAARSLHEAVDVRTLVPQRHYHRDALDRRAHRTSLCPSAPSGGAPPLDPGGEVPQRHHARVLRDFRKNGIRRSRGPYLRL